MKKMEFWTDEQKAALKSLVEKYPKGKKGRNLNYRACAEDPLWLLVTTQAGREKKQVQSMLSYLRTKGEWSKGKRKSKASLLPVLRRSEVSVTPVFGFNHRTFRIENPAQQILACPRCLANIQLIAAAMGGDMPIECPKCGANLQTCSASLTMPIKSYA